MDTVIVTKEFISTIDTFLIQSIILKALVSPCYALSYVRHPVGGGGTINYNYQVMNQVVTKISES